MKNQISRKAKTVYLALTVTAYVFGCSFLVESKAASSGLSSAIAFQRPDGSPAANASGTVSASQTTKNQKFTLTIGNIPINQPIDGLALFLSVTPGDTNNFQFVTVLDGGGTNGTWRLNMQGTPSAPPLLGVTNVTDLAGRIVRICDNATNVFLETTLPSFVPSLSALSYNKRAPLLPPDPAPSPKATGVIRIHFNALKGTSSYEVRVKNLSGGNSYCCWFLQSLGDPTSGDCPKTPNLINGNARFNADTGKGEQLFANGLQDGYFTVEQISGKAIEIRDQFGVTHLQGICP